MTVVLIAEDDQNVRDMLERMVARAGFTVRTAADGLAALRIAVQDRPDVILTDFDMPRLSGLDLCRAIRGHHELSDTPVAILSGSFQPGDPRALEVKLCATVVKPFDQDDIVSLLRRLVAGGRHDHAADPSRCPLGRD